MTLANHKLNKLQLLIFIALIISGCDDFEKKFNEKIDQGQINAKKMVSILSIYPLLLIFNGTVYSILVLGRASKSPKKQSNTNSNIA